MADTDYVPVGAIVPLGRTLPTQDQAFLLCNGAELSAVTYSELYDAIGTTFGGDKDKKTFKLPDLRGLFPRGASYATGADPDVATRIRAQGSLAPLDGIGTSQSYATARPKKPFTCSIDLQSDTTRQHGETKGGVMKEGSDRNIDTCTAGGDLDTRPVNVYVEYYIKAQS